MTGLGITEFAVTLSAGRWAAVPTGLAVEIPPGFEAQVRPRSGLAAKHGIQLVEMPVDKADAGLSVNGATLANVPLAYMQAGDPNPAGEA